MVAGTGRTRESIYFFFYELIIVGGKTLGETGKRAFGKENWETEDNNISLMVDMASILKPVFPNTGLWLT